MKKGDLFIYYYKSNEIYYGMYINESKYYYQSQDDIDVYSAEFFTNLDVSKIKLIKNINIDNLSNKQIRKIVAEAKSIAREQKIDNLTND
jgi:hypothetical protein